MARRSVSLTLASGSPPAWQWATSHSSACVLLESDSPAEERKFEPLVPLATKTLVRTPYSTLRLPHLCEARSAPAPDPKGRHYDKIGAAGAAPKVSETSVQAAVSPSPWAVFHTRQ